MAALPLFSATLSNVEYGRVGELSLRMDARIPEGPGPHPAIILVHGGGWVRGDRVQSVEPLFDPLSKAGFAWFSISYRLATDFLQIGTAVNDVQMAVTHIRENSSEYKIDPNRIALAGESAGAHLASLAALNNPASVSAVVALYSPSDLEHLAKTSTLIPTHIRQAIDGTVFADMALAFLRSLSPINKVSAESPPFLLIHGTADGVVPVDQSYRMQQRMKEAGVVCDLITVEGGSHGIRYWDRSPAQSTYLPKMIAWLHARLS